MTISLGAKMIEARITFADYSLKNGAASSSRCLTASFLILVFPETVRKFLFKRCEWSTRVQRH